jgi:hypothetical protein
MSLLKKFKYMKLEERLQILENLLNSKMNEAGNLEIARQMLQKEILELSGKINLIKELIKEENSTKDVKEEAKKE